jgi:hypothetical protein
MTSFRLYFQKGNQHSETKKDKKNLPLGTTPKGNSYKK